MIHRDLKPENVFFAHVNHPHTGKDHLHVKIGDLGLVASQEDNSKGFAGAPGYIAPELYQYWDDEGDDYDARCDIWSVGMILADMLLPKTFTECDGNSAAFQSLKDSSSVAADDDEDEGDASKTCLRLGAKPVLKGLFEIVQASNCGPDAMSLLAKLLEIDPSKRPSAAPLLNSSEVLGCVKPPINVN